ncbi:phage capsid scaffolding protein, partial [Ralstonia solanacearum]
SIKRLFSKQRRSDADTDARFTDMQEAVQTVAQQVQTTGQQFSTALKAVTDQLTALNNQAAERDKQFNALKAQLEQTDAYAARPPATGGDGTTAPITTDC